MARKSQQAQTDAGIPETPEITVENTVETIPVSETPETLAAAPNVFVIELSFNSGVDWSVLGVASTEEEAIELVNARKAKYKAFGFTGSVLRINGQIV